MSKHKNRMRKTNTIKHKVAKGDLCMVGQIAYILGGPALVVRLWRFR